MIDSAVAKTLQRQLTRELPIGQKAMAGLFNIAESAQGASHAVFAIDTGTVWLPKVSVARSWAERFECSFVEFIESAFFYYMVPISAGTAFQKLYRRVAPGNVSLDELMKPVSALTAAERKRILPVKAACLLSGFGIVTIGGEYALNFVKNLLTEGFFKKSHFADVINLRTGGQDPKADSHKASTTNRPQRTDVTDHALKRILQCWALCGGMLAGSWWLAKHGGNRPQVIEALDDILRKFDFTYDRTNKKFGLNRSHFQVMLPIAVLGYVDAARDKLEFMETGIRASITAWFLGWGSPMLQNWAARTLGHKMPGLMDGNKVKPLATLFADSIQHAMQTKPNASQAELTQLAKQYLMPRLARKTQLYLLPLMSGMLGTGLLVALMTQFWTRYRFKAIQKQERDFITRYVQANPQGVQQHWRNIDGVKPH